MNVFFEFYKIVQHLQREKIAYALVGGVAMAFYTVPRFTEDIDILIWTGDLEKVKSILGREGYIVRAVPWTFKDTKTTLHRFLKIADEDQMVVDVMATGDDRFGGVIERAVVAESEQCGQVRVANKTDLVWMKRLRNSEQDQLDIKKLQDEAN